MYGTLWMSLLWVENNSHQNLKRGLWPKNTTTTTTNCTKLTIIHGAPFMFYLIKSSGNVMRQVLCSPHLLIRPSWSGEAKSLSWGCIVGTWWSSSLGTLTSECGSCWPGRKAALGWICSCCLLGKCGVLPLEVQGAGAVEPPSHGVFWLRLWSSCEQPLSWDIWE